MKWPFPTSRPFSAEARMNRAYSASLARHGANPQGVFWHSRKSQTARFATLIAMVKAHHHGSDPPAIADIGCGYGALFAYLRNHPDISGWRYQGVDINASMIAACEQRFPASAGLFRKARLPSEPVDYCLFSGTFNLCMTDDVDAWQAHIIEALAACWQVSRSGMALNLLCGSRARVTNNIFYADRDVIQRQLRQHFGKVQAVPTRQLRHDMTFLLSRR